MMKVSAESQGFGLRRNRPDSSRRLRILFLVPFAPNLQAGHGGGRVIAQLITQLAERHGVGLCYLRSADEPVVDNQLRERCEVVEEVVLPPIPVSGIRRWSHRFHVWKQLLAGKPLWAIDRFSPIYEEGVKALLQTWQPDIVQIEFHVMGQYLSALADYPAPRILVQHEPGEESAREHIGSRFAHGRIVPRLDLLAWKRFERSVVRQVQAVVVFTERDLKAVRKLNLRTPVVEIPFGVDIPEPSPRAVTPEPLSLLFVGNFKHSPNLEAAGRLINKIFPKVQAQFPEVRLYVVGDHLPPHMLSRANQMVIATGYVPDVQPYLDKATVVVVPLKSGGGLRVKVLDALAAGKPVVASSRALEGLDLIDGEQVMLAEDDDAFHRAIVQLLRDPGKRASLATQARAWALANLSWNKTVDDYENLYYRLLREDRSLRLTV